MAGLFTYEPQTQEYLYAQLFTRGKAIEEARHVNEMSAASASHSSSDEGFAGGEELLGFDEEETPSTSGGG